MNTQGEMDILLFFFNSAIRVAELLDGKEKFISRFNRPMKFEYKYFSVFSDNCYDFCYQGWMQSVKLISNRNTSRQLLNTIAILWSFKKHSLNVYIFPNSDTHFFSKDCQCWFQKSVLNNKKRFFQSYLLLILKILSDILAWIQH